MQYQELFDIYEKLLTDAQREVCYLHFMCDLSLTEIAEQKEVSKQSVSTMLQISKQLLQEYESKLLLLERQKRLSDALDRLLKSDKIDRDALLKLKEFI